MYPTTSSSRVPAPAPRPTVSRDIFSRRRYWKQAQKQAPTPCLSLTIKTGVSDENFKVEGARDQRRWYW